MPYFHFSPKSGIRSAMDVWMLSGGTHHEAFTLGNFERRWQMLADVLKIQKKLV
jgi:L-arabinose isomerase